MALPGPDPARPGVVHTAHPILANDEIRPENDNVTTLIYARINATLIGIYGVYECCAKKTMGGTAPITEQPTHVALFPASQINSLMHGIKMSSRTT